MNSPRPISDLKHDDVFWRLGRTLSMKRSSGTAIAAGVLVMQLLGIWVLLAGGDAIAGRGTPLLIVLSATAILAAGLYARERLVARSATDQASVARDTLHLAMESGRTVAWDWDVRTGRDVWLGDLKTMFGIPEVIFEGTVEDFRRRVHPDDRELVWRAVAEARQERTMYRAKFRLAWPDGTVRVASAAGKFYYAPNGEATRMLGIATDITELSEIEDRLSEGQERLRLIVEGAMDAIISVDDEQHIQVFNGAAEKMFGCRASDAIGAPLERFLPDRFRAVHREHVRRFTETGSTYRTQDTLGQLWALRSDGVEFPIEASISHTTVGTMKLSTVILRDVTERERVAEALRESEERFRLMADAAPVMLWMAGPDKLCHYFNRSWLEFTGRPMDAELGNGWLDRVHPEDLKQCVATYERAVDRREPFRMEYRLRRHDGEYRWVLDTGAPRLSADKAFSGYIGSAIDVTELKLAEGLLSGLSHKLMDSQESERAWIARELHDDVAQRMALLTIELERLRQGLPRGAVELRTGINDLCDRAVDLGKDIQVISHRLHSSKLEYLGIASAAAACCKDLSAQRGITISFTQEGVPEDLSKEVALVLFRVLQEALMNAVTHAGVGTFSVALRGGADDITLEVLDTGNGFDPKAALRNHGLGLVSMQERLRRIHGEISIDSEPGAGTRVRARVPLGIPANRS